MPLTDDPQLETSGQPARRQPLLPQQPVLAPLRDWLACVVRTGYVLLFVLGGLLVWWGILAAVGDAAAARAAGLACLTVFVLWLAHGVLLAILLTRAVLNSRIDLLVALPVETPAGTDSGACRPDAVTAAAPHSASLQSPRSAIDPEAETVRSRPEFSGPEQFSSQSPDGTDTAVRETDLGRST